MPTLVRTRFNCDGKAFLIRGKASGTSFSETFGSPHQMWLAGSPLYVAVGCTTGSGGAVTLAVGATLGAFTCATTSFNLTFAVNLTELRFRGAPTATFSNGEVVEFEWIGGEFVTSGETPYTTSTLPNAFTELSFLDGP